MNRWFTRYLFGIENDVEADSQAWIVREGNRMSKPTEYDNYPNPDAEEVDFRLTQGGTNSGGLIPDGLSLVQPQGIESLVDDHSVTGPELAKAKSSRHRLLFATVPLKESMHISGSARVSIRMACNKPAACLSVWLVSLPWTDSQRITDDVITRGWADPQNARSLTEEESLVPGEFRVVSFDLQPDDQVILAGEQIGLMIFSSDHDFTLWPEPGTELSVDLDATKLTLPIVGGVSQISTSFGTALP